MNALTKEFLAASAPGAALRSALEKVAPQWPLHSFVAVNPFMGYADTDITVAAARLSLTHDATILAGTKPGSPLPTLADLFGRQTGFDAGALVVDAISKWAAAHFDLHDGVGANASEALESYASWREDASIDRTIEVWGAKGFRDDVKRLPKDATIAAEALLDELDLPEESQALYLDRLVGSLPGWMSYARHFDWMRQRDGEPSSVALGVLTARLAYDVLLGRRVTDQAAVSAFRFELVQHARLLASLTASADDLAPIEAQEDDFVKTTLSRLQSGSKAVSEAAPNVQVQAVFCIDVRSERLRRHLELASSQIRTHGFAGFFGLPVAIRRGEATQASCPPLLRPGIICETASPAPSPTKKLGAALHSLKTQGAAAFAYVEALGVSALPSMAGQALGLPKAPQKPHRLATAPLSDHEAALTQCAAGFLTASGLGDRLAPRVLLLGHEAHSVNNPHAAGLQCGACGGRSGADNARVMVQTLNNKAVRARLASEHGLFIPDATRFLAGVHNTTTDEITLFDADGDAALDGFWAAAQIAGAGARAERAVLLNEKPGLAMMRRRGRDPSQVLPEWGLAGCAGFIAAPRDLTRGKDLQGRVFLHDYDWRSDLAGSVLEQILTAPVIVANWINLQYFASSASPHVFGAGDKVLHNIVGHGVGVIEGNGGDLRLGLAYQSVCDASGLRYPAQRLCVFIAARQAMIEAVVQKHEHLRNLVENRWLLLFQISDFGALASRRTSSGWTSGPGLSDDVLGDIVKEGGHGV
jgi:uncharacterized protein YbcC (UPF0753/DUF2309 family)